MIEFDEYVSHGLETVKVTSCIQSTRLTLHPAFVANKGWTVGILDSTKMWLESWWWLESLGGQIFASIVVVVIWLDWHHNSQRYQSMGPSFEDWFADRHLCCRLARWISGGYWWWLAYCHSSSGWNLLKWNRWDYGLLEDSWGWAIALVLPQRSPQKIIVCTRILRGTDCFRRTSSGDSDVTQNLHSLYFDIPLTFTFHYTDGKFTLVPTSDGLETFFQLWEQLVSALAVS